MEDFLKIEDGSGDKNHFTIIPNIILNHSTPYDRDLYAQMKRITGDNGLCWMSQEKLAKQCGVGITRLKKSIAYLIEHKWIEYLGEKPTETSGGKQTTKVYRIVDLWKINADFYSKGVSPENTPLVEGVSPENTKGCRQTVEGVSPRDYKEDPNNKEPYEEEGVAIAPPVPVSTQGTNPNTYSKKPHSPREFTNARRADLGKPPLQPKRTEKQDIALQALKLIDYFKQQFYEMHGEGVDSYFRGNSSENGKLTKLAKECVLFLGSEAKAYVDDWLAGRGEFFAYDPSNAWSRSQMSKWKASKTIRKETQNFMPTI